MSRLAKRGLVAHHADFIEQLAHARHAVFDKTGTLTEDAAAVADIAVAPHLSRNKLLSWLASAERRSRHPVARALAACVDEAMESATTRQMRVQTHPGCGLEANFVDCCGRSRRLRAGTPQWIHAAPADYRKLQASLRAGYGDPIAVELDGTLAAVCLVHERLRPTAAKAWSGCQQLGMKVTVLTGDRVERAIAAGFDSAYGRLSPIDKARLVGQWEDDGERCLFVGDGINDAAALGRATSSIALASGAELAAANAQATLVSGDLSMVPWAVELSRRSIRLIRTNLLWAASYNAIGIAMAAAGYLHPIAAALLMVGSSLIVTGRSIRFAESQAAGVDGDVPRPSDLATSQLDSELQLRGACRCN
jgi:P-type E1-E2 ATPase